MPSRTIKLSEETYQALSEIQEKKETYDEAVKRLLIVYNVLHDVSNSLGPSHFLKADRPPGKDIVREASLERADLESRRL